MGTPTFSAPDEPAVEALLRSPKLALHVRSFRRVLAEEEARRERFYEETDADQKAEFINGDVVMSSPARLRHNVVRDRLHTLLSTYVQVNDLGVVLGEKALIALTRNDYEPDVCFFKKETATGFAPNQWKFPAPDFACEVLSGSTAERDRGVKFEDYAAHGVAEYWLIDPDAQTVEQYALDGGRYALRIKAASGEIESGAVEGFAIPVRALFDNTASLDTLRRIVQE